VITQIGWCGVPAVVSSKISSVETLIVALPTRFFYKDTGITESIGRYVLVKMTDDAGNIGWGEAPALKDWGGEFGRYFGESAAIDTGLVAAGQAVEHYEMARYGALIAWAGQLNMPKAAGLLNESLQEEMKAEKLLTQIGASKADKMAATKMAA